MFAGWLASGTTGKDYSTSGTWTVDGVEPRSIDPASTASYVNVQLDIASAGMPDQILSWAPQSRGAVAPSWLVHSTPLGDGSTVKYAAVTTADGGTQMAAERILPDGRKIVVNVTDGSAYHVPNMAKPYQPFPWTIEQLVAVVSDSTLKVPTFA